MSRWSGKCDLFDHIAGQGGWFNSEGQPIKFNDPDYHGPYYSDELKDFEAFKEKTGGVIHQHYKIQVDEYNQDFVKEHCKFFNFIKLDGGFVTDTRCKSGQRKLPDSYVYTYYNKTYGSLKELNKHGVYIETDIHFDTLLDLIPYYPYLVTVCGDSYVVISNESYVDEQFKKHLNHGWISEIDYKKELQKHYLEVCKKYFLYKLDERTKVETINQHAIVTAYDSKGNVHYFYDLIHDADYMHDIEFVWDDGLKHSYWTSPKLTEHVSFRVELSKEDVEYYLAENIKNGTVKIKYVEKCEFPLEIN